MPKAWFLLVHKHKQHKKNRHVRFSCADAYVVALTSENGVDISTSISTRTSSLSAILFITGVEESWYPELSQIYMPFCTCACPYAYTYALVKIRLNCTSLTLS